MMTATRYPDALLSSLRLVGDPLADSAIAELRLQGHPRGDLAALVLEKASAGGTACRAFLKAYRARPTWVDFEEMRLGSTMFFRLAPLAFAVLAYGSLIESYAGANGAKVLIRTKRLEKEVHRRLLETGQMLRDSVVPGGLLPKGPGFQTVMRVRLLHAMVRKHVMHVGQWDASRYGIPVNQEDMAGTLLAFDYLLIRGLRKLGIAITSAEEASYHAIWRYVGYLSGICPELLAETPIDCVDLAAQISRRQQYPDEDSRTLAYGVFNAFHYKGPLFLPRRVAEHVSRFLLGEVLADRFGFARLPFGFHPLHMLAPLLSFTTRAQTRIPGAIPFFAASGRSLMETMLHSGLDGHKPAYRFTIA